MMPKNKFACTAELASANYQQNRKELLDLKKD